MIRKNCQEDSQYQKLSKEYTGHLQDYHGHHQLQAFYRSVHLIGPYDFSRHVHLTQVVPLDFSEQCATPVLGAVLHLFEREMGVGVKRRLVTLRIYFPVNRMRNANESKVVLHRQRRVHLAPNKYEYVVRPDLVTLSIDMFSEYVHRADKSFSNLKASSFKLPEYLVPSDGTKYELKDSDNKTDEMNFIIVSAGVFARLHSFLRQFEEGLIPVIEQEKTCCEKNGVISGESNTKRGFDKKQVIHPLYQSIGFQWLGLPASLPPGSRVVVVRRHSNEVGSALKRGEIKTFCRPRLRRTTNKITKKLTVKWTKLSHHALKTISNWGYDGPDGGASLSESPSGNTRLNSHTFNNQDASKSNSSTVKAKRSKRTCFRPQSLGSFEDDISLASACWSLSSWKDGTEDEEEKEVKKRGRKKKGRKRKNAEDSSRMTSSLSFAACKLKKIERARQNLQQKRPVGRPRKIQPPVHFTPKSSKRGSMSNCYSDSNGKKPRASSDTNPSSESSPDIPRGRKTNKLSEGQRTVTPTSTSSGGSLDTSFDSVPIWNNQPPAPKRRGRPKKRPASPSAGMNGHVQNKVAKSELSEKLTAAPTSSPSKTTELSCVEEYKTEQPDSPHSTKPELRVVDSSEPTPLIVKNEIKRESIDTIKNKAASPSEVSVKEKPINFSMKGILSSKESTVTQIPKLKEQVIESHICRCQPSCISSQSIWRPTRPSSKPPTYAPCCKGVRKSPHPVSTSIANHSSNCQFPVIQTTPVSSSCSADSAVPPPPPPPPPLLKSGSISASQAVSSDVNLLPQIAKSIATGSKSGTVQPSFSNNNHHSAIVSSYPQLPMHTPPTHSLFQSPWLTPPGSTPAYPPSALHSGDQTAFYLSSFPSGLSHPGSAAHSFSSMFPAAAANHTVPAFSLPAFDPGSDPTSGFAQLQHRLLQQQQQQALPNHSLHLGGGGGSHAPQHMGIFSWPYSVG